MEVAVEEQAVVTLTSAYICPGGGESANPAALHVCIVSEVVIQPHNETTLTRQTWVVPFRKFWSPTRKQKG